MVTLAEDVDQSPLVSRIREREERIRKARARREWAARLCLMPVADAIAELDALETHQLFDVSSSPHLFDHRARRLADDILQWRAMDGGVNCTRQNEYKKPGERWDDESGLPSAMPDPHRLGHPDHNDPEDWLRQSVLQAISDRRPLHFYASRHSNRTGYLGRYRGLHNLQSSIDRALHVADNTVRFP